MRKLVQVGRGDFRPIASDDVERVGARAAKAVVCRAHNKLRSVRDLAEFSDYELVAEDR